MYRILRRSFTLRLFMLATMSAFLRAGVLHAQECEAVDEFDQPRECTLTEEFGHCMDNVETSREQCSEKLWDWVCDVAAGIDTLACSVESIREGTL